MRLVGTRFFCAIVLGTIVCGNAAAQVTPEQQSALRANCRSDFMSKCSGVSPGGKEALTCLQTHVSTLSAGCKAAVSATLPKPTPVVAAPAAPVAAPPAAKVETPAPPVPAPKAATQPAVQTPPPPQPATVTKPAAPKVAKPAPPKPAQTKPDQPKPAVPPPQAASAPPQTITPPPAPPPPRAGVVDAAVMLRACKLDMVRYCGNAGIGDGRKLACLNENASRLTIRCRTALKVTAPIR